jgi:hypothetical protein
LQDYVIDAVRIYPHENQFTVRVSEFNSEFVPLEGVAINLGDETAALVIGGGGFASLVGQCHFLVV